VVRDSSEFFVHVLTEISEFKVDNIEPSIDPFKSSINLRESPVNLVKSSINLRESPVNLVKSSINLRESPVNSFKSPVNLCEPPIRLSKPGSNKPVERREPLVNCWRILWGILFGHETYLAALDFSGSQ
jgi:hypothetical protein